MRRGIAGSVIAREDPPTQRRERRGFALVLMVFLLFVFAASAAMAIDVSLAYVRRGELSSAADATALAGVVALGGGAAAGSVDTALHYADLNRVSGTVSLAAADVLPGTWTAGGGFVGTGSWTTGGPFAVKTTTRYTLAYIFARLFGFSTKNLTCVAVAVRGSVGSEGCVRPWAVSYQSLLDQIGGGFSALTHDLTAAEVATLKAATIANAVVMNQGDVDGAPGQMRSVQIPPGEYGAAPYQGIPTSPSASVYRSEIYEDCITLDGRLNNRPVSVDDWLEGTSGQEKGPTGQGISQLLCGNQSFNPPCLAQSLVNVAIWDRYGNSPRGFCSPCYHIKYMGVFYVTGYQGPPDNNVLGYFSSLTDPSAGGFVPKPGPIVKNALVQ